jgi:hypothetical protein
LSEDVKKLLQLNGTLPSGSKRRYPKSRGSKKAVSERTQKSDNIVIAPKETVPAQVAPAEFDVEAAQDVVFKPNPGPQTDFLSASEREVLYGGAAGGGKSYAMLADPLHGLNDPNFSGLLVRHTTEELRELIKKAKSFILKLFRALSGLSVKVSGLLRKAVGSGCRILIKIWTLLVTKVKRLTGSDSTS